MSQINTMTIQQFQTKWDNGESKDSGFGCGGPKVKPGDDVISIDEIEFAGGIQAFADDFKRLDSAASKTFIAKGLDREIAGSLIGILDPKYNAFQSKYDNGIGFGSSQNNHIFESTEIKNMDGFVSFRAGLEKLTEDAQIAILSRVDKSVEVTLSGSMYNSFFHTFDNGNGRGSVMGDNLISASEVESIGGVGAVIKWEKFIEGLEIVLADANGGKKQVRKILDSLLDSPPILEKWIMDNMPEYIGDYNLRQFPNVREPAYHAANKWIGTIGYFAGNKDIAIIQKGSLPPFKNPLPTTVREQMYMRLYDFVQSQPDGYKMDIWTFAHFVSENEKGGLTATVPQLFAMAEAMGNYSLARTESTPELASYNVSLDPYSWVGGSWVDESTEQRFAADDEGKAITQVLKKAGLNYDIKYGAYYFQLPSIQVEYHAVVTDKQGSDSKQNAVMGFYTDFQKYRWEEMHNNDFSGVIVYEKYFDEAAFLASVNKRDQEVGIRWIRNDHGAGSEALKKVCAENQATWYLQPEEFLGGHGGFVKEKEVGRVEIDND